jgi:hypothetical protein
MIGEGLLSLSVGLALWLTSNSFAPSVYNFFQHLSLDQMETLLGMAAQCIFAFGALNVLLPVLFYLCKQTDSGKQSASS